MKRRGHASLLLFGLLLQLVLGAADPSCLLPDTASKERAGGSAAAMAMTPGVASGELPMSDETPCDLPADASPDAPRRAPPMGATAPCHALAPCGVSFVVARPCESEVLALVASRVSTDVVSEPASVTLQPELPPPRA